MTDAVAIDTAAFQSADSFIAPPKGIGDPAAAASFEMVLDAYCTGADLYVPLPKDVLAKRPNLFALWDTWTEVPNVRLTSKGIDEIGGRLTDGLLAFVKGSAPSLAQWVAFQFTPTIVEQYIGRTGWELDDVREASSFASELIHRPEMNNLLTAVDHLRSKKLLVTPSEYYQFLGSFESENHLAISYLVSVYLRGWSYASGLDRHPGDPEYRSLWLRAPALRDPAITKTREPIVSRRPYFWGRLVRRMFDPATGALPPDFDVVRTLALKLRQNRADILAEAQLYAPDSTFRATFGSASEAPTKAETAIVEGILKSRGALPYADTGLEGKLVSAVRGAASLLGDRAAKTAEYITADLRRTWIYTKISTTEAHLRLRFRRSTFWDVYRDLGVADLAADATSADTTKST